MVQSISLDDIKSFIRGIRKSNKGLIAIRYFKKKLEINLTEDDIAKKISFLLKKSILSNKSSYLQKRLLLLTENVDDIV